MYFIGRITGRIPKKFIQFFKENLKKVKKEGYISGILNFKIYEELFKRKLKKIAPDKLECKPEMTSFMAKVCGEKDVNKFSRETDELRDPCKWEHYRLKSWESAQKALNIEFD
jgi:hypothetical protein